MCSARSTGITVTCSSVGARGLLATAASCRYVRYTMHRLVICRRLVGHVYHMSFLMYMPCIVTTQIRWNNELLLDIWTLLYFFLFPFSQYSYSIRNIYRGLNTNLKIFFSNVSYVGIQIFQSQQYCSCCCYCCCFIEFNFISS